MGLSVKVAFLAATACCVTIQATYGDEVKDGEVVFHQCAVCHSVAEGQTKLGPSLYHVVGRKAGTLSGYPYSDAMKNIGLTWDQPTLERYLASPRTIVPGTKMAFPGLKDPEKVKSVIAYLKSISG